MTELEDLIDFHEAQAEALEARADYHRRTVAALRREWEKSNERTAEWRALPIEHLELSTRGVTVCRLLNLKTAGELYDWLKRCTRDDVRRAPNLGHKTLRELFEVCGIDRHRKVW